MWAVRSWTALICFNSVILWLQQSSGFTFKPLKATVHHMCPNGKLLSRLRLPASCVCHCSQPEEQLEARMGVALRDDIWHRIIWQGASLLSLNSFISRYLPMTSITSFFCTLHRLLTCIKPKAVQVWMIDTTLTANGNQKGSVLCKDRDLEISSYLVDTAVGGDKGPEYPSAFTSN